MLPKTHFLVGAIISLLLFLLFPSLPLTGILIFLFSSFLIDFDHYLYFVYKKRSLNLKKAIIWFKEKKKKFEKMSKEERRKYTPGFYAFHGLEWPVFFLFLGFFLTPLFYFVSMGMTLHLVLDYIEILKGKRKLFKFSIIYDSIKFKKLKKL